VHHPEKTVVIDLHDQRFNELVVEVDDPEAAVKLIQNALLRLLLHSSLKRLNLRGLLG